MDVDVAVAGARLYDGDGGALHAGADEGGTAARDEHVHEPVCGDELLGLGVTGIVLDVLERVCGQAGLHQGGPARRHEGEAGLLRSGAALEDAGVARAQAEAEGVCRDIGTGLIDEGDHAQRHGHALDAKPVVERRAVEDAAERVRLAGDLLERRGDAEEPIVVEREAVHQGLLHARGTRALEVAGVCGEDGALVGADPRGGGEKGALALRARGAGELGRDGTGERGLGASLGHGGLPS